MVEQAEKALPDSVTPKIVGIDILEKAHEVYGKDTLLSINLGLALRCSGQYDRAKQMLLWAVHRASYPINITCILNAAFCDVKSSNYDDAIQLFDAAMQYMSHYHVNGRPTHWADVSGTVSRIILKGDMFMEVQGKMEEPFELVGRAIKYCSKDTEIPSSVRELAELYKSGIISKDTDQI